MTNLYDDYRLDGCLADDANFAAPELLAAPHQALPSRVDLREHCSPVENQGKIGSCTANATAGALEYHQIRSGQPVTDLSRLFLYYNSRALSDRENLDRGTSMQHALASVLAYGACPESMWPYQKELWSTKPTEACYNEGMSFTGVQYARLPKGHACKAAVAAGLPVIFGMRVPKLLFRDAARTGRIDVPADGWPDCKSAHAMLIVGYDDADKTWLVRNSWGTKWGDEGHVHIHYEVMERYGFPSGFWTIGAIAQAGYGLSLAGTSLEAAQSAIMAAAPQQAQDMFTKQRSGLRSELRDHLTTNLATAKKDFRSRLRGK